MAATAQTTDRHCPECGASLRSDATACWLCAFPLSPEPLSKPRPYRTPIGSIIGFVLSMLLLMVALPVAVIIALFCLCVANASQGNLYRHNNLEMVILLGGGAFVVVTALAILSVYFFAKLVR